MTNVEKWLAALAGGFQVLEDAFQQLLVGRDVNTAIGEQLTLIGKFVQRPRNGIADDELYRRYVRAQIRANRSDGTPPDLLSITSLVLFDPTADIVRDERGGATVVYRIEGVILDWDIVKILNEMLRDASSDGTRLILEWFPQEPEVSFDFSNGEDAEEELSDYGFANAQDDEDSDDPGVTGGFLIGAID